MSLQRPTLIVHTVYFPLTAGDPADEQPGDPERAAAERLGLDLYDLLTRPREEPLARGPGIPVRVATRWDQVDLDEAEHVVLIPVLGARAHQWENVRSQAIESIKDWDKALKAREPQGLVIPVLHSPAWRASESEQGLTVKPLLTALYARDDPRRATLDEIVLWLARVLNKGEHQHQNLFISHSKADMKDDDGSGASAAEIIRNHIVCDTTGSAFFDANSLLAGENLAKQIEEAVGDSIFLMLRGDQYSTRAWCQREQLIAKKNQLACLTVELLESGEERSLPYAGNTPTVTWDRSKNPRDEAAKVVRRAMVEGVRRAHFLLEGERIRRTSGFPDETFVAARPPELIDIPRMRALGGRRIVVLHPDPELTPFEQAVLHEGYPQLRTVTPTTAFRGILGRASRGQLAGWRVGLSLSETPDVGGPEGLTGHHVDDATVQLARSLISVGASISYGGDFRRYGFTWLLASLVEGYNQSAKEPADFLQSYLAAHVDAAEGESLSNLTVNSLGPFGNFAARATGEAGAGADAGGQVRAVLPAPASGEKVTPAQSALYFSDMRRVMAHDIQARVIMAGKTTPRDPETGRKGYGGRFPGVLEEAWRSLEADQPLYVVGGFGGAAALVADLLEKPDGYPAELQEATFRSEQRFSKLIQELDGPLKRDVGKLGLPGTLNEMARQVRQLGRARLGSDKDSRVWNGLSVDENQRLFRTRDPLEITTLVLKGLLALEAERQKGKTSVELVHGTVTQAEDLDLVVFPTFSDVVPGGVAVTIDQVSEGAASRAYEHPEQPAAVRSGGLGTAYLYAADLGSMLEAVRKGSSSVEAATKRVLASAQRYGFARVGLVTFLGSIPERFDAAVDAMVRGLEGAGDGVQFLWFENDEKRFEELRTRLEDKAEGIALSTSVQPLKPDPTATIERPRTLIGVRQRNGGFAVQVMLPAGNGIVPVHESDLAEDLRASLVRGRNEKAPRGDQLEATGRQLSRLLFRDEGAEVLETGASAPLVIVHDVHAGGLPWEAMSVQGPQRSMRPALDAGIVRRLEAAGVRLTAGVPRPPRFGKLRVLLVIDPTKDLEGAREEGGAVRDGLVGMGFTPLVLYQDEATVRQVMEALMDPDVDVLHYCGHAYFDGLGDTESGLTLADGNLTLAQIRGLSTVPRLAFFNACEAGRVRAPVTNKPFAQSFAEFFLRAGVSAYVGTFWKVTDIGAKLFSAEVYRQLGSGATLGEAVVEGRKVLEAKGKADWANYLLYGDSDFQMVRSQRALTAGA